MAAVTFTYNPVPAPACYPPDMNSLAQQLTTGGVLSGTIPDTAGGGIIVSSATPTNALANKVWLKTDSAGRPLGLYGFYLGNWRKVYTGIAIGEMRMFRYPPSQFDGTGRAFVGSDMDGWALCNGNNGTPNFQDSRFPAAGFWNGNAWVVWDPPAGAWQSQGGQGQNGLVLHGNNLPPLNTRVYGTRQGGLNPTLPGPYVGTPSDSHLVDWPVYDANTGVNTGAGQGPLPLPNYFAMGLLMFVGYQ